MIPGEIALDWGMMSVVKEYQDEAQSLEREAFLVRYKIPFLIRKKEIDSADPRNEYRSTLKMKVDREKREVRVEPSPPSPMDSVVRLEKSDRNSFHAKILVGRTETNDVVIPHLTVSKHHAFLKENPENDCYCVTDTGSTNGTKLNGQALTAREPRDLSDGDELAFGDISFTFYTPGGFYDLLMSISALR